MSEEQQEATGLSVQQVQTAVMVSGPAEADAMAAAEGLTIVPAANSTGYRGVSYKSNGFVVRVSKDGTAYDLGIYSTIAEAALCYSRFVGPEESAKQAQSFHRNHGASGQGGGPRRGKAAPSIQGEVLDVVACDASDDQADDEAAAIVVTADAWSKNIGSGEGSSQAVPRALPASSVPQIAPQAAMRNGSIMQQALKRKRSVTTIEYAAQLSQSADTITIPVPPELQGSNTRCKVVVEFETRGD